VPPPLDVLHVLSYAPPIEHEPPTIPPTLLIACARK
jgi:hypothetical protein